MGQKVHPIGFRLGINRTWDSRWFAKKVYSRLLHEDLSIRSFLKKNLSHAGISRIEIERAAERAKVNIYTSRPAIIIGKKGSEVERIKKQIQKLTSRSDKEIFINIKEVRNAEIDAQLVAENIALQLERRIAFRRVMKKAISSSLRFGAKGIKIACGGRLAGAEMARREWYLEGRVPLHTLRAQIDFGFTEAKTTYGMIGIKVWIYKGDSKQIIISDDESQAEKKTMSRAKTDRKPASTSKRAEKRIRRRRRSRKIDEDTEQGTPQMKENEADTRDNPAQDKEVAPTRVQEEIKSDVPETKAVPETKETDQDDSGSVTGPSGESKPPEN